MTSEKIKYLEFIQSTIERMSKNSFQLKGWMITIVSAFIALFAEKNNCKYLFFAIIPTILFAALDCYYLLQERRYRMLFKLVSESNNNDIKLFDMNANKYHKGIKCYLQTITSPSIAPLYSVTILGLLSLALLIA